MGKTQKKMGGLNVPEDQREDARRRQESQQRGSRARKDREKGDDSRLHVGPGKDDDPDEDTARRG